MRGGATGVARRRLPGLTALAFLAAAPACDSSEAPAPFPGARRLDLACLREHRPPTPEECRTLARALVEAYGGEGRLETLQFTSEQDIYLLFGDIMSNHALQRVWFRSDAHFRQEREFRGGTTQMLLSAGASYLAVQGAPLQPTRGESRQTVWWEYKVLDLPAGLLRDGTTLEGRAPEMVDDRLLMPLEMKNEHPPEITVFVDPYGPVIRRVEAKLPMEGESISGSVFLERWVDLSSFQRAGDVLFPWRMDLWSQDTAEARRQGLVEVRSYQVLEGLSDDEFRPPP